MLGLNEHDADVVEDGLRPLAGQLIAWHQGSTDGWSGVQR
jgi:hypothetical protein